MQIPSAKSFESANWPLHSIRSWFHQCGNHGTGAARQAGALEIIQRKGSPAENGLARGGLLEARPLPFSANDQRSFRYPRAVVSRTFAWGTHRLMIPTRHQGFIQVSWMSSAAGNHQSLRYLRRDDSDRAVAPFFAGPLLRVEEPFVVTPSGVWGRVASFMPLPLPNA